MKKSYIRPEFLTMEFCAENVFALSQGTTGKNKNVIIGLDEEDDEFSGLI